MTMSIELGTSHIKVYDVEQGLLFYEPSIVVAKIKNNKPTIISFGKTAIEMSAQLGEDEKLVQPIKNGIISDYHCAKLLLDNVLEMLVGNKTKRKQLELILCIPSCATQAQINEFVKLLNACGVSAITLRPQLCCICKLLDSDMSRPYFVVDIGAGKTEIGLTTVRKVIDAISLSLGGEMIDLSIYELIKYRYNLSIPRAEIERVKESIASLYSTDATTTKVNAFNLTNSVWQELSISSQDIYDALILCYDRILEGVNVFLNSLDKEYQDTVRSTGIFFSGLGCEIIGFEKYAQSKLNTDVYILDSPAIATVEGALS